MPARIRSGRDTATPHKGWLIVGSRVWGILQSKVSETLRYIIFTNSWLIPYKQIPGLDMPRLTTCNMRGALRVLYRWINGLDVPRLTTSNSRNIMRLATCALMVFYMYLLWLTTSDRRNAPRTPSRCIFGHVLPRLTNHDRRKYLKIVFRWMQVLDVPFLTNCDITDDLWIQSWWTSFLYALHITTLDRRGVQRVLSRSIHGLDVPRLTKRERRGAAKNSSWLDYPPLGNLTIP